MPTFKKLDEIFNFLPKDVVGLIFRYAVRDCGEGCYCEDCWYDAWKDHFES